MSTDQKQLVESTLKVLLAPYRQEDVDEVFAILKASGGVDKLHLAFYQEGDLLNDKTWDIWRVEGPAFVWHFSKRFARARVLHQHRYQNQLNLSQAIQPGEPQGLSPRYPGES